MKEVLDDIERWRAAGQRVAVARVVGIEGSSPRDPGRDHGRERRRRGRGLGVGRLRRGRGRAARRSRCSSGETRARHRHVRLLRRRGVRGRPHVRRHDPPVRRAARLVSRSTARSTRRCATRSRGREPVALATVDRRRRASAPSCSCGPDGEPLGTLGDPDLDRVVAPRRARRARGRPHARPATTARTARRARTRSSVFIESFAPPPRMIIFGAVDFTAALGEGRQAARLPRDVCDARAVFATVQRFPMADEVVNDWPDRYLAEGRRRARPARRGVRAHPRPQVRRARDRRRARAPRSATSARWARAARTSRRIERLREAGVDRRRARPASCRRSGSTSAPARRRRRRSSICAEIIAARTGRRGARRCATLRARSTAVETVGEEVEWISASRAARGGRGGVEGARARRRRRRSPPKACTVAICGRDADTIDAAAAEIGPRRGAARRRRLHVEGAAGFVRDARAGAGRGRHPRVPTAAARPPGNFAHTTVDAVPRRLRAQLPRPRSRCATRRCPRCASSGGGGWSRSRRSRCASRSPD